MEAARSRASTTQSEREDSICVSFQELHVEQRIDALAPGANTVGPSLAQATFVEDTTKQLLLQVRDQLAKSDADLRETTEALGQQVATTAASEAKRRRIERLERVEVQRHGYACARKRPIERINPRLHANNLPAWRSGAPIEEFASLVPLPLPPRPVRIAAPTQSDQILQGSPRAARLQHALATMASNMGTLTSHFKLWDVDCDGLISYEEMRRAIEKLNLLKDDDGLATDGDPGFGDEQVWEQAVRDLFAFADRDGSGTLDFRELRAALRKRYGDVSKIDDATADERGAPRALKLPTRKAEGEYAHSDGAAEERKLLEQIKDGLAANRARVIDLLHSWDIDGDGSITADELGRALAALSMPVEKRLLRRMFDNFDASRNGSIEFEELNRLLKKKTNFDLGNERYDAEKGGYTAGFTAVRHVVAADKLPDIGGRSPRLRRQDTVDANKAAAWAKEAELRKQRDATQQAALRIRKARDEHKHEAPSPTKPSPRGEAAGGKPSPRQTKLKKQAAGQGASQSLQPPPPRTERQALPALLTPRAVA